jgi:hypothetical protein
LWLPLFLTLTACPPPGKDSDDTGGEADADTDTDVGCVVHVEVSGSDATGCGDEASPCRTVSFGVAETVTDCRVKVGVGTFGAKTGETLPVVLGDGIVLAGAGAEPDGPR